MSAIITVVLEFLQKTLLPYLPKILAFVKKYYKIVIPVVISLIIIVASYFYISSLKKSITYWQNKSASAQVINQVAPNVFESQASATDFQKLDNEKLQKRLDESNRKAEIYERLSLRYQISIDSIKTYFMTLTSHPTIIDSTQRYFNYTIPKELTLRGRFQIKNPYLLFVDSLEYWFALDVSVSQAKDGSWWTDIDTKTPHLSPSQINVKVFPRSVPWEWFGNLNLYYNSGLTGLGINAGIKKGDYSGNIGVGTIKSNSFIEIGLTKYFEF